MTSGTGRVKLLINMDEDPAEMPSPVAVGAALGTATRRTTGQLTNIQAVIKVSKRPESMRACLCSLELTHVQPDPTSQDARDRREDALADLLIPDAAPLVVKATGGDTLTPSNARGKRNAVATLGGALLSSTTNFLNMSTGGADAFNNSLEDVPLAFNVVGTTGGSQPIPVRTQGTHGSALHSMTFNNSAFQTGRAGGGSPKSSLAWNNSFNNSNAFKLNMSMGSDRLSGISSRPSSTSSLSLTR
jgi:hypothetical protein